MRTGGKWRAEKAVEVVESQLRQKELVGFGDQESRLEILPSDPSGQGPGKPLRSGDITGTMTKC